jgi:hypothetical protein
LLFVGILWHGICIVLECRTKVHPDHPEVGVVPHSRNVKIKTGSFVIGPLALPLSNLVSKNESSTSSKIKQAQRTA